MFYQPGKFWGDSCWKYGLFENGEYKGEGGEVSYDKNEIFAKEYDPYQFFINQEKDNSNALDAFSI